MSDPQTTTQADDAMPKIVLTVPTNAVSVPYEMKGGSADEPGWVNLVFRAADGAVIQKVRAVGGTKDHPMGDMLLERVGAGGGIGVSSGTVGSPGGVGGTSQTTNSGPFCVGAGGASGNRGLTDER